MGDAGCDKPGKVENTLTKAERDALVVGGTVGGVTHPGVMALARKVATDTARRVLADRGRTFDRDELEADAIVAAVEASHFYDADFGTKFSTYCHAYMMKAMLHATDERDKPDVRLALDRRGGTGGRRSKGDTLGATVAAQDEHEPDGLRHADFLTADMRAALDLLEPTSRSGCRPDGQPSVTRRAVELVIEGHDLPAVAAQLGVGRKEVRLIVRNAVRKLRAMGQVPPGLEPFPADAERAEAQWERQKVANLRKARDRADAEAERDLQREARAIEKAAKGRTPATG